MPQAFTPITLRNLTIRNRFIKTATNEGMWENGLPSQKLVEHHARLAQGGVGLTTVAYGAVNADGRTMAGQMYMCPEVVPGLKRVTDAIHSQGGKASLQLTHCGFFTNNHLVTSKRPVAPSRLLNKYGLLSGIFFSKQMTSDQLLMTRNDFARSARLAIQAGFDAIELHMGHGYLLNQFLSPVTNKRKDEYGGSLENRMRFPLEVVDAVREALGAGVPKGWSPQGLESPRAGVPLICKINLHDGMKKGFNLEESIEFAKRLEAAGVDLLVLSGGFTSHTPFYLMRGDVPLWNMIKAERKWRHKAAFAVFGKFVIGKYKFEENFFMPMAREMRKAVKMPLAYIGGVSSAKGVEQIFAEGFDMVAIGRALIHDPDFILKIKDNEQHVSQCNHCNICVAEMDKNGVRCVI